FPTRRSSDLGSSCTPRVARPRPTSRTAATLRTHGTSIATASGAAPARRPADRLSLGHRHGYQPRPAADAEVPTAGLRLTRAHASAEITATRPIGSHAGAEGRRRETKGAGGRCRETKRVAYTQAS